MDSVFTDEQCQGWGGGGGGKVSGFACDCEPSCTDSGHVQRAEHSGGMLLYFQHRDAVLYIQCPCHILANITLSTWKNSIGLVSKNASIKFKMQRCKFLMKLVINHKVMIKTMVERILIKDMTNYFSTLFLVAHTFT